MQTRIITVHVVTIDDQVNTCVCVCVMRGRFLLLAIALFGACSRAHSSDDDDDDSTSTSSSTSVSASSSTSADEHCFPCAREEAPCVCLYAKHIRPSRHAEYIQYAVDYYSLVFLEGTFNFGDNHSVSVTTNVRLASVRDTHPACIYGGRVPLAVNAPESNVTIESIDFNWPRYCGIHVERVHDVHIDRVRMRNIVTETVDIVNVTEELAYGIAIGVLSQNLVANNEKELHSVRIEHCSLDLFGRDAMGVPQRRLPAVPMTNVRTAAIRVRRVINERAISVRENTISGANYIALWFIAISGGNVYVEDNSITPDPHGVTRFPDLIESNLAIEILAVKSCNYFIERNDIVLDAIQSPSAKLALSRGISAGIYLPAIRIADNRFTFKRLAMQAVYIADSFPFNPASSTRRYNVIDSNRFVGELMEYTPNVTEPFFEAASPLVLSFFSKGYVLVGNDDSDLVYPSETPKYYAFFANNASDNLVIYPPGGVIGQTASVDGANEFRGNFTVETVPA